MAAVIQRPLRGSRISTFYPIKSLPSLSSLDSAFQLQEYISLLIRLDVHDVEAIVSLPGKPKERESEGSDNEVKAEEKDAEKTGKNTDVAVDEACWIYEHLRRLAQDLSHPLITMLQQECTRVTCPEMKAGEWLYLCVAHGDGGATEQCCAIDYILHTLDSATALLNSPRAFPSRLRIPEASRRHFSSLARRLGRIFAHAYFHHREAFEQAEVESSLYARFLALASKFDLVPAEFLAIPPRAPNGAEVQPPRLLGAALDPQGERSRTIQLATKPFGDQDASSGATIERPKGTSPPGLGSDSPRKYGRHRTDTMVFSEAANVVGELAKYEQEGIGAFPEPSTSHGRGSGSRDVEDYRTVFSAIMTAEDDLPGESSSKYTQELPSLYQDEATPGPAAPSSLPDADDEPSAPAAESITTDEAETAGHVTEAAHEPEVVAPTETVEASAVPDLPEEPVPAPTADEPEASSKDADSSTPAPGTAPPEIADEPEVSTDAEPVGDEAPKPSKAQEEGDGQEVDDDDDEEDSDGEESDDAAPAPAPAPVEAPTPAETKEDEEENLKEEAEVAEAVKEVAATTSVPTSGPISEGADEEVLSTDSDEPSSTA